MATLNTPAPTGRRTRDRRRKHLINPAFQWKWVASIMVVVFAISALNTVLTFGVMYQAVRAITLHGAAATFSGTTLALVLCGLGFAIAPALALGLWSVFISHRICGPLYVLERGLKELSAGRFPSFRALRKNDEFKQLHAEFGRALDALKNRDDRTRDGLSEILQTVRDVHHASDLARQRAMIDVEGQLLLLANELGRPLTAPIEGASGCADEEANLGLVLVDAAR
jgi:methyl-accepting chemotaxis protein